MCHICYVYIIAFYWSHNATLALLAAYNAMQPDKENVRKHKTFWQNLVKELQTLGYNASIIAFHIHKSEILHWYKT